MGLGGQFVARKVAVSGAMSQSLDDWLAAVYLRSWQLDRGQRVRADFCNLSARQDALSAIGVNSDQAVESVGFDSMTPNRTPCGRSGRTTTRMKARFPPFATVYYGSYESLLWAEIAPRAKARLPARLRHSRSRSGTAEILSRSRQFDGREIEKIDGLPDRSSRTSVETAGTGTGKPRRSPW